MLFDVVILSSGLPFPLRREQQPDGGEGFWLLAGFHRSRGAHRPQPRNRVCQMPEADRWAMASKVCWIGFGVELVRSSAVDLDVPTSPPKAIKVSSDCGSSRVQKRPAPVALGWLLLRTFYSHPRPFSIVSHLPSPLHLPSASEPDITGESVARVTHVPRPVPGPVLRTVVSFSLLVLV